MAGQSDTYMIQPKGGRIAIADVCLMTDGMWWLVRINVPEDQRGNGHGRELLKQVIEDADQKERILALGISPSGPLDWDALRAWYERYGFEMEETEHGPIWIRKPRT